MSLNPLRGTYAFAQALLPGGFQLGAGGATVLRDGTKVSSSQKMFSVTRVSAGLYTVTYATGLVIPELPFIFVDLHQAAAPTTPCKAHVVKSSWSQSTRSFQIQVLTVGTTPAASDGDSGDRVSFLVMGSINSAGTDPA